MRVRGRNQDARRRDAQFALDAVAQFGHERIFNGHDIRVQPQQPLRPILQVQRAGGQRIEHAGGWLCPRGEPRQLDSRLRRNIKLCRADNHCDTWQTVLRVLA